MTNILKSFLLAGALAAVMPSAVVAQEKKDVQQIIITRTADKTDTTVVVIKGDKITINGKDVVDMKDVDVKLRNLKGISMYSNDDFNFNFEFDENRFQMYSIDSNRAMLGVVTETTERGARVNSVSKNGAAEKAGLKKGDIITKIGDKTIKAQGDVTTVLRAHKPGDKVAVTVLRDGKEQRLNAELAAWKGLEINTIAPSRAPLGSGTPGTPYVRAMSGSTPRLGLSIQDTDDGKGVKVLEIETEGNAAKAGVQKGDIITHVNEKAVETADEMAREIKAGRNAGAVKLRLIRNGKTQNIEVKLPKKLKTVDV